MKQPCVLTILRSAAATLEEARVAIARWETLANADRRDDVGATERRFRRRAYERARGQALAAVAIEFAPPPSGDEPAGEPVERRRSSRRSRGIRGSGRRHGRGLPAQPVGA